MTFDLDAVRRCTPVVRVVVAETRGSVPREVGAAMLVDETGVTGTIGGGALEFEAIDVAREVLTSGTDRLERRPLGPALGQCCGGAVSLLFERWDSARLADLTGDVIARPLPRGAPEPPLAVERRLAAARSRGEAPVPGMTDGWMIEPVTRPGRAIWVWGAGHVGRAIVGAIAPLPNLSVTWADSGAERFPETVPSEIETVSAENPADLVPLAPAHAEHFVLTYSHALDLEICHRVLSRSFGSLGLIGSATKRARFRSRLAALGHPEAQIDRVICPIGDPALGKHPQAIALGVATAILKGTVGGQTMQDTGT